MMVHKFIEDRNIKSGLFLELMHVINKTINSQYKFSPN